MATSKELSKLLAMQAPLIQQEWQESVSDPTDYKHRIKHGTFTPSKGKFFFKKDSFESPEVDFSIIRKACRTEPLFRRRNDRFQNLIWKNGYALKTEEEEAKEYVLSRMEVFTVLTGKSFDAFLRELTRELIMFDNCLVLERRVKVKDLKEMGINLPMRGIGPLAKKGPVVSYEVIPLDSVQYKRDEYGNISMWQQSSPGGKTKTFSPDEVILICNGKESGDILAFPSLQMVLTDARILRQLETDASLAGHRLAFPIFMYKVGDPRYEGTLPKKSTDLDGIWNTLEGMLLDGALIIPGADSFEVILDDVKLEGLSSVLEYFKQRVITSMGLSPIHLGDVSSANRSVADRLDVQLYDDVKSYQKTLKEVITFFFYGKWLMEGGYNLRYGELGLSTFRVEHEFREIDTDSMIQRENHACSLWVQDVITHDEMRERIGLTPCSDEQLERLYSKLIGDITNKQAQDLARTSAAATAANRPAPSKTTAQKSRGGAKQRTNAKTRAKKTSSLESEENINIYTFSAALREMQEDALDRFGIDSVDRSWDKLQGEVSGYVTSKHIKGFSSQDMDYLKFVFKEEMMGPLRHAVVLSLREGLDRGFEEARAVDPDVAPMKTTLFNQHANNIMKSVDFYLDKLISDLFARVETEIQDIENPTTGVEDAFLALHYRLEQIVTSHNAMASNWGVCMVAQHAGYDQVWQESESGCSVCRSGWLNTSELKPQSVPPFSTHPNCGCRVHIAGYE